MKFLFDENISYRIVKKLSEIIPNCLHVSQTGLHKPASDRQIWRYAQKYDFTIVTFDEDFQDLVNLNGFPPKVILLRTGNSYTQFISEIILNKQKEILQFYQSDVHGLLEIF
ncbi:DUF5615 family PIN-like protein [Dyadobacter sp. LHD-138]|uniref:DUF5615 family PIN-like protein n=1 Tax=Dyadobacter sp. LHD-138 TaxID=3071413 RepID=UPI0027DEB08F|nr:DUF5615 family PIN-like protein [Dyadobacter sp. LHD-138]MDQ6479106.1 DUF5615 family PIN-like protein [Dyadobacter sp. LHD-138]